MPAVLHDMGPSAMSNPDSEGDLSSNFSILTCSSQPKLKVRHFLSRGGGVLVPMIPLDELPVALQGVPARLGWDETEDMVCCGEYQSVNARYSLIDGDATPISYTQDVVKRRGRGFAPGAKEVRLPATGEMFQQEWKSACAQAEFEAKPGVDHDEDLPELALSFQAAQKRELTFPISIPSTPKPQPARILPRPNLVDPSPLDLQRPFSIGPVTTHRKPLPPSGIEPDETLKEYCSYWVRTGECAFAQQGCKYKHIMPMDRPTLKKIYGTDHWPKWWVERQRDEEIKAGRIPAFSRTLPVAPVRLNRQEAPRRPINVGSALTAAATAPRSPQINLNNAIAVRTALSRRHERNKLAAATGLARGRAIDIRTLAANVPRPVSRASSGIANIDKIIHDPFLSPADEDLIELESANGAATPNRARLTPPASGLSESKWATPQPEFPRLFIKSPPPQVAKASSTTDVAPHSSPTSSNASDNDDASESTDEEGEVTEASKTTNESPKKSKHKRRSHRDHTPWYKERRIRDKTRKAAAAAQQSGSSEKNGKGEDTKASIATKDKSGGKSAASKVKKASQQDCI